MSIVKGEIRIPANTSVWQHELHTAEALANAGYIVEFLPTSGRRNMKSPDISMNDKKWEIKSPKTDKLSAIERNLKRATKQSANIILDSKRISGMPDKTVQKFLESKYRQQTAIKALLFINRQRQIIDVGASIK